MGNQELPVPIATHWQLLQLLIGLLLVTHGLLQLLK